MIPVQETVSGFLIAKKLKNIQKNIDKKNKKWYYYIVRKTRSP